MVFKTKNTYFWADGFTPKVKADIVGGVIEKIEARDGHVTKEAFLEESRSVKSPTHALFEWDDKKAAESYRLEQARWTISHLRISYENSENENQHVRAFVNTSPEIGTATYENVKIALEDDTKRKVLFEKMRRELDIFVERNRCVEGLAELLIMKGKELKEV